MWLNMLNMFYSDCSDAIGSEMVPLGFVGGEVYAHHRGFIGVLGVLGLWCYAHCECKDDTYSHLVIVADCCFAGIWGNTLESIMNSEALEEYLHCFENTQYRFRVLPMNLKHLMVVCLHHCGISCKLPRRRNWMDTTVISSRTESRCQMMTWRCSTRSM